MFERFQLRIRVLQIEANERVVAQNEMFPNATPNTNIERMWDDGQKEGEEVNDMTNDAGSA